MSLIRFSWGPFVAFSVAVLSTSAADDPFQKSDPFGARQDKALSGEPIEIEFRVVDQKGSPVSGVQIKGAGIYRSLRTDNSGMALLKTDKTNVSRWASDTRGRLSYRALPPSSARLAKARQSITVSELSKNNSIAFTVLPGTLLAGKIVGDRDGDALSKVQVVSRSLEPELDGWNEYAATDESGFWSMIVPSGELQISVDGLIQGCRSADQANQKASYSRTVQIPSGLDELQIEDFQVEQLPYLKVTVVDAQGQPVPNATVSLMQQCWHSAKSVWWGSIPGTTQTSTEGTCKLIIDEIAPGPVNVFANVTRESNTLSGRAELKPENSSNIQVTLRPDVKLGGLIHDAGVPAKDVDLVLYETVLAPEGGRLTIAKRDVATTDLKGRFIFDASVGLDYLIATKARNGDGVQRVLHRSPGPTPERNFRFPDLDLSIKTDAK